RPRAAGDDRRSGPGVRGPRHAAGLPLAGAAGRRAGGHGGAGAGAPGQRGVRAGPAARRRAPGLGAGAGGGDRCRHVPSARAARRAVRAVQIPGIKRGATSMSATAMAVLMQVSSAAPLPEEAPAEAVALAADAAGQASGMPVGGGELDLLGLVLQASLPVQLVMLLLLFASIASWVIIFRKKRMLDRAEKE